jgi:regulator of sirC expression with transglutaminase-like and TPR domain
VKRRAFVLAAAAWGCGSQASPRHWGFARALLSVAERDHPESTPERALRELSAIADRVSAAQDAGADATASTLTRVLFDELGFSREVSSTELGVVLLPGVLRGRRGNCVGLGTLYLALAQALDLPAGGVLMPGHFYVRVPESGAHRNVELLRRGQAMPDSWYGSRYPLPSSATRTAYARPLSEREVLGVVEYDIGNERRRERRIADARAAYARAVALLPDFAQARASLASMQHLLGEYAAARANYRGARLLDPGLRGLDQNIALLDAEAQGHD